MSNMLEQAQEAAQQGNWSLLSRYLQQALVSEQTEEIIQTIGVEPLVSMAMAVLEAGDFQDRWDVAKIFPLLGNAAIAPLMERLQDDDADLETRWFAARILGGFNSPAAIQPLIEILHQSKDDELSAIAAEALTHLGTPAIADLTNLLSDNDTRLLAVKALAQIRHSETINPLLCVVNDSDPDVRAAAIEAVGSFHDPRIPPVLIQALKDPAAMVRQAAIIGLSVRTELAPELDLVNRFAEHLWDLNVQVCQQSAIALGRIGTPAAVDALFRVLNSPHTPLPLQLEAVRALAWAGTGSALDALRQMLFTSEVGDPPGLQQEIVTVLGRWQNPDLKTQASQTLIDALNSTHLWMVNPAIKQTIAIGLGYLQQPQARESLTQLLADEDMGVRLHAVAALKSLGTDTSRQYLERLAHQTDLPDRLKRGITIALQEWNWVSRG